MEKIKIGNVEFKSRAVLAPMAGITDRAYRELCVEFGAAYCVSEMVSSKALSFNAPAVFRFSEMTLNVWLRRLFILWKTSPILLI